jgi:hypothetical protein
MESKISAPTRLEEILAEWDLDQGKDHETVTLASSFGNVTVSSPYTVTGAVGTTFPNTIYTTSTGTAAPWATFNPNTTSAKINLTGKEADIEVNGWSLVDAVKRIEERLDLFQPNPELEKEWADLKKLGDRYRKLEQRIKDKQATWNRLKAMPAPQAE